MDKNAAISSADSSANCRINGLGGNHPSLDFSVLKGEIEPELSSFTSFLATRYLGHQRTLGLADSEVPVLCSGKEIVPLFDFSKPNLTIRMHGGKTAQIEISRLELVTVMDRKLAIFNASLIDGRVFPIGRRINLDRPNEKSGWIMFASLGYHSVVARTASDSGYLAGDVVEDLGYGKRYGLFRATADHFSLIHGAAGQSLRVHHISDHGEMAIVSSDGPYLQSVGGRILKLKKNGHGEDSVVSLRAGDYPMIGTVSVMGQTNLAFWYPHDLRVDISWSRSQCQVSRRLTPRGLFTQGELNTELVVIGEGVFDDRSTREHGVLGLLGLHRHVQLKVPFCMLKRGPGESFFDLSDIVSGLSPVDRIFSVIHTVQVGRDGYILVHVSNSGDGQLRSVVLKTRL